MRTIKFRGRSLDGKEWYHGDLEYNRVDNIARIHTYDKDGYYIRQYYVNPDTVGQFTGLQDKNGKDIYEGDIICFVDGLKRVNDEWIDNKHIYKVEYSGAAFSGVLGLSESTDAVEIIGDIYDNPDLLKGGQP